MAEFGQGFVQSAVLSENNAVRYKMSIAGSCTRSTLRPYIKLQDKQIGPTTFSSGMNVIVFNTESLTIEDTKNYILTSTNSTANRALVTYIDSLAPGKLVIFISEGNLLTSQELCDWFKIKNSTAWPSVWDVTHLQVAYCAFFITGRGTITSEHVMYKDINKTEAILPILDIVFDYFEDIGSTGFPKRTVSLDVDKTSNASQELEIVRLPENSISSSMAEYNIQNGDAMYLKFSTYIAPGALPDIQGTTRLSLRWFNGNTLVSNTTIDADVNKPGVWQPFERDIDVPNGCDRFTIYVAKTNINDIGAVKNVVFCEVSRPEYSLTRSAEFGVNGIRMNKMIDGTTTDLLVMSNTFADDRGRVFSAEFREKQD